MTRQLIETMERRLHSMNESAKASSMLLQDIHKGDTEKIVLHTQSFQKTVEQARQSLLMAPASSVSQSDLVGGDLEFF